MRLSLLAIWLLVALAGPLLLPHDAAAVDGAHRLSPPSLVHPLGTDQFGRDVLSRVVTGARYALLGVLASTLVAGVAGIALGLVAGYAGGALGSALARLFDLWLSLPSLLFAIAVVGAVGPSYVAAMVAIGVMRVPSFALVARASTLTVRQSGYVEAARSLGASGRRLVWRHALPNVAVPLLALAGVRASTALLAGSALSFVGLGAQIPEPEWGALVAGGRAYLETAWWIAAFPCLALILTALALQLAADAASRRLDPRVLH